MRGAGFYAGAGAFNRFWKRLLRFRFGPAVGFMERQRVMAGMALLMGTINQCSSPESDRAQILVYVDLPACRRRTTQCAFRSRW